MRSTFLFLLLFALEADGLPFALLIADKNEQGAGQLIGCDCNPCAIDAEADTDENQREDWADDHHGNHGDDSSCPGIPGTAQTAGHDELGSLEGLDKGDKEHDASAHFDDLRIIVVEGNDGSAEEGKDDGEQKADAHAHALGAGAVGLCHVRAFLAQGLPDERGGGNGEGLTGHKGERLNVHADLVCGKGDGAQIGDGNGEDHHAHAHEQLFCHGR